MLCDECLNDDHILEGTGKCCSAYKTSCLLFTYVQQLEKEMLYTFYFCSRYVIHPIDSDSEAVVMY